MAKPKLGKRAAALAANEVTVKAQAALARAAEYAATGCMRWTGAVDRHWSRSASKAETEVAHQLVTPAPAGEVCAEHGSTLEDHDEQ